MTGRELAEQIKQQLATEINGHGLKLALAVILIGNDAASEKYVNIKKKACELIGINFKLYKFDANVGQAKVIELLNKLNADKKVTGIIVQLPIPLNFNVDMILEKIDPKKDVDGLCSLNFGKLAKGLEGLFPATPEGVINLLRYYQISLTGKRVALVGQSNLVGKPLALMLLKEKATVTVCNSKTKNLKNITLESDIIISAVGHPKLIKGNMVKNGAVVIDIGTTLLENRIVGDVDFERVAKKASFITPSPGGVGPMTVAMLLSNVVKASKLNK